MTEFRFPRLMQHFFVSLAALALSAVSATQAKEPTRILSLGGAVTEILYELGADDRIVAVDTTSQFPPEALKRHKSVGYLRALSTEGVLSIAPDVIIASDKAGPPEVVRALKASGIDYFEVNDEPTADALVGRVRAIAGKVGSGAQGDALVKRIDKGFADLASARARLARKPSVLFILAVQGGRVTVGGSDTVADAMLKLAGATNAAANLTGFKPVSEEAIMAMDPEAILVMNRTAGHSAAVAVLALPGVAATRAGRDQRVFEMDGLYIVGFGPRAPDAAADLMKLLQAPAQAPKAQGSKG
jgi:iron complex transport system substrate-binding protein